MEGGGGVIGQLSKELIILSSYPIIMSKLVICFKSFTPLRRRPLPQKKVMHLKYRETTRQTETEGQTEVGGGGI